MDAETKSEPIAENYGSDGVINPVLTGFRFRNVGWYGQFLQWAHLLETCYVRIEPLVDDDGERAAYEFLCMGGWLIGRCVMGFFYVTLLVDILFSWRDRRSEKSRKILGL